MRDPTAALDAIVAEVCRLCRCDDASVALRYAPGQWAVEVLHVEGETGADDEDPAPDGAPCTLLTIAEAPTLSEALAQVRRRAPGWRAEAQAQIERERRGAK